MSARGGEVVDGDTRLSAAEAEALVAAVAGGLRERGVGRGDAVAWQVPNSLAAAVLTRACWRLGAVAAPVLHSFGAADVEAALGQIDPALVVELAPGRDLRPGRAGRSARRGTRAGRRRRQPALRRRAGPVHLGLDGRAQGGAAHPPRPELEGQRSWRGCTASARPTRC